MIVVTTKVATLPGPLLSEVVNTMEKVNESIKARQQLLEFTNAPWKSKIMHL